MPQLSGDQTFGSLRYLEWLRTQTHKKHCHIQVLTFFKLSFYYSFLVYFHHGIRTYINMVSILVSFRCVYGPDLEKGMATHSSILAWRIPWTEQPDGLQSVGFHRVGHDWSSLACMSVFYTYSNIYYSLSSFLFSEDANFSLASFWLPSVWQLSSVFL